ncbi:nitrate- and nitrite sensing domain-containing protein [Nocardiopsis sp. MG754419]|uniref:sensor histidine kinase n=1 Tax=Nocardiopsis sp. MG754419 TaxID=2259865 RepID=UPI0024B2281A|nr:nitrate- and nitrite sensing domain-containing protein [Nocardiopsis sp. MG754419]MBR8743634.1 histidine kinase [Nocardiopsis sp. MG754419]
MTRMDRSTVQAVPKKRGRTITARIRAMVMIPTTALVALWLILTFVLGGDAIYQLIRAKATEDLVTPAAVGLVDAMAERSATIAYVENTDDAELAQGMVEARQSTDDSLGVVVEELIGFADLAPGDGGMHIEMLHGMYQEIGEIREAVDSGDAGRGDVLDYYNELILHGADSFDSQGREGNEGDAVSPGFTAIYMFRTVDVLAQADAQIARGFATDELSVEDQREFTAMVGAYESLLDANADYLEGPGQTERYGAVLESPEYAALQRMQTTIIEREVETETTTDPVTLAPQTVENLSMPVNENEWDQAYGHVVAELTALGADEAGHAAVVTRRDANQAVMLAVGGSLGVAAVTGLAFLLARRSSRALNEQLLTLRDESRSLAEDRLPSIMERLHRGERIDTDTDLPELRVDDDEIGEVAKAFNTAQRAAVDEAVQQTELRHGVNRVFLNIAHRSQTLVHRQLRLLDKMEREQEDPDQLAQLFKLDHLATRSRRNAENLLILGGEAPGRTWHRPMPLIDVLRGAISESGDYTRVKRERIARVNLNGPAVADVIHLVAELVDNAAMFSPPHTSVRLSSEDVPNGVTIEIEDRGLGMTEAEFTSANSLLAEPPEFDVMRLNEKMRLGLFVVSHLAHRHGIRVHLRPSPYGGVQAIVLLPQELISGDRTPMPTTDTAGEEIWEVREIMGRTSGNALESGRSARGDADRGSAKPVLTSVSTPVERDSGEDVLSAPLEDRPPLPTRGSRISAVPDSRPDRTTTPESGVSETPAGTVPAPEAPSSPAPDTTPADDGRPPLPKRRPQENLAPQLADTPSGGGPASGAPNATPPALDGSERLARLRKNMSAFQKGTDRGRREGRQHTNDTDKDTSS